MYYKYVININKCIHSINIGSPSFWEKIFTIVSNPFTGKLVMVMYKIGDQDSSH